MNDIKELKELMHRYLDLRDTIEDDRDFEAAVGVPLSIYDEFERVEDELLRALDD